MSACQCHHGLDAVRSGGRNIHQSADPRRGHAVLRRDLRPAAISTREVAAAFEQPAKQFADGEVAFENQYRARSGRGAESAAPAAIWTLERRQFHCGVEASVQAYCVAAVRAPAGWRRGGMTSSFRCAAAAGITSRGAAGGSVGGVANWGATCDKNARGKRGSGTARETSTPAQYPARCGGWRDGFPANRSWRRTAPRPPVCERR